MLFIKGREEAGLKDTTTFRVQYYPTLIRSLALQKTRTCESRSEVGRCLGFSEDLTVIYFYPQSGKDSSEHLSHLPSSDLGPSRAGSLGPPQCDYVFFEVHAVVRFPQVVGGETNQAGEPGDRLPTLTAPPQHSHF